MTLLGWTPVGRESAKSKRQREDAPTIEPMRKGQIEAQRRNPTNDEKKARRKIRSAALTSGQACMECATSAEANGLTCAAHGLKVRASFTSPGYYVIDATGAPVEGPSPSYSVAISHLNGRAGVQYFAQPQGAHQMEPFPPQLQQVNGAKSDRPTTQLSPKESSVPERDDWRDALIFEASDGDDSDKVCDDGSKPHSQGKDDDDDGSDDEKDDSKDGEGDSDKDSSSDDEDDDGDNKADDEDKDADDNKPPWLKSKSTRSLPSHVRESQLLQAMALATPEESYRLMAELQELRSQRTASVHADRETDLGNAYIHDTLSPVMVHEHHTAATDWISTVAEFEGDPNAIQTEALTKAAIWFGKVVMAVKEDGEEFHQQADAMAQRIAGAYGEGRDLAYQTFLSHASFLRQRTAGDGPTTDVDVQAPNLLEPWSVPPRTMPPVTPDGPDAQGQVFNPNILANPYPNLGAKPPLNNGATSARHQSSEAPAEDQADHDSWPNPVPQGTGLDSQENAPSNDTPSGLHTEVRAQRHQGSDRFDEPHKPYSQYLSELSEGAAVMPEENYAGSMAAAGPGEENTSYGTLSPQASKAAKLAAYVPRYAPGTSQAAIAADIGYRAARAGVAVSQVPLYVKAALDKHARELRCKKCGSEVTPQDTNGTYGSCPKGATHSPEWGPDREARKHQADYSDPKGNKLGENPAAEYDPTRAHEQSGEAQSSLPLAPTGPSVSDHMDFLTDFTDTGPAAVPSDRAPIVQQNKGGGTEVREAMRHQATASGHWITVTPMGPGAAPKVLDCRCGARASIGAQVDVQAAVDQHFAKVVKQAEGWADYPAQNNPKAEGPEGPLPAEGYGENPHGEMWPYEVGPVGDTPRGAADVANVATPGGPGGYPQPNERTSAFRARVQQSLAMARR